MSGTIAGGKKATATNKKRYGDDFYKKIGQKGGSVSRGGGFASSHELAVSAGRKGGSASRRGKAVKINVHVEQPKKTWRQRIGL
jgi:general stress protein YciG